MQLYKMIKLHRKFEIEASNLSISRAIMENDVLGIIEGLTRIYIPESHCLQ